MPTSPTSPSGGSRSKAPTISAASAASSTYRRAELLVPTEGAGELLAAEPGIIEHMNEDHADAVRLYATRLASAPEGFWRMSAIDPEGCDLIFEGDARRIRFRAPISTPGEARAELVRLANEAREPD